MTASAALQLRKQVFNIDDNTVHNLRLVAPLLRADLASMVDKLYRHLLSFPEAAKLLPERALPMLKSKQVAHWRDLFEGHLDDSYVARAMRIGQLHFERRVPPYLYLAAYTYMQDLILTRVAEEPFGKREMAAVLSSVSRLIALDVELALAAYTRAIWSGPTVEI